MSGLSKTLELLDQHSHLRRQDTEVIAQARHALAESEALLQQGPPSTFLGKSKASSERVRGRPWVSIATLFPPRLSY